MMQDTPTTIVMSINDCTYSHGKISEMTMKVCTIVITIIIITIIIITIIITITNNQNSIRIGIAFLLTEDVLRASTGNLYLIATTTRTATRSISIVINTALFPIELVLV